MVTVHLDIARLFHAEIHIRGGGTHSQGRIQSQRLAGRAVNEVVVAEIVIKITAHRQIAVHWIQLDRRRSTFPSRKIHRDRLRVRT